MMPKNEIDKIFLTGFMGVGKSVLGKMIAEEIQWRFIDTDDLIETAEKRTIKAIFSESGESRFREIEKETVSEVCIQKKAVIALGGGALMDSESLALVSKTGLLIWLRLPLANILGRMNNSNKRPLMNKDRDVLEKLYRSREKGYQEASLVFDVVPEKEKNIQMIVRKITESYEITI